MKLNFEKSGGLIPTIIQEETTSQVLMLGFMNQEAIQLTQETGRVHFFSRTKNRIWMKGETSENYLFVKSIAKDCDDDSLLIKVISTNSVCHTGSFSCFGEKETKGFLYELEHLIHKRIDEKVESSYTSKLYEEGINKVAQKVGEEAVELVIEAKDNNEEFFKNEAADLLYHFLILLKAKNIKLQHIEEVLKSRN